MSGQTREPFIVFGSGGVVSAPTSFAEFGSLAANAPLKSTDIATIMSLPAWTTGLQATVYTVDGIPVLALEDDNSWRYVHSYQVGQILQDGVPQWQVAQVYQPGSWVQDNANLGQVFMCLAANTVGGSLPNAASTATWLWMNPPLAVISGALPAGAVPKIGGVSTTGPAGSKTLVAGLLSDNGVNVVIGGVAGTNGLQFPDGSTQKTALVNANVVTTSSPPSGYVARPASPSWALSGTRVFGTTYQNNTTKPIFVIITINRTVGSASVFCDSTSAPTTVIARVSLSDDSTQAIDCPVSFFVLPGYYYKVVGGTLAGWTEQQ